MARFGRRWIRFFQCRLVAPRVGSGERIGRWLVRCRHNAVLGLPLYCSEGHSNILRSDPKEPADADHDHPRRSVMIDKNVLDSSDFLVVHPYTETPTSLGARHSVTACLVTNISAG